MVLMVFSFGSCRGRGLLGNDRDRHGLGDSLDVVAVERVSGTFLLQPANTSSRVTAGRASAGWAEPRSGTEWTYLPWTAMAATPVLSILWTRLTVSSSWNQETTTRSDQLPGGKSSHLLCLSESTDSCVKKTMLFPFYFFFICLCTGSILNSGRKGEVL